MRSNPELARKARAHVDRIKSTYYNEIQASIQHQEFFRNRFPEPIGAREFETIIEVQPVKSLEPVETDKNVRWCILNFASPKSPGGLFLDGADAQEEYLCHETTLYPILSSPINLAQYYYPNKSHLNKGLYCNSAVWTPDVIYEKGNCLVDIITCAAPNARVGFRYGSFSEQDANLALMERIKYVLQVAAYAHVENLVLGAFGCGVYGNDPIVCAAFFNIYLRSEFAGVFRKVVFAIPRGENYATFKGVIMP